MSAIRTAVLQRGSLPPSWSGYVTMEIARRAFGAASSGNVAERCAYGLRAQRPFGEQPLRTSPPNEPCTTRGARSDAETAVEDFHLAIAALTARDGTHRIAIDASLHRACERALPMKLVGIPRGGRAGAVSGWRRRAAGRGGDELPSSRCHAIRRWPRINSSRTCPSSARPRSTVTSPVTSTTTRRSTRSGPART